MKKYFLKKENYIPMKKKLEIIQIDNLEYLKLYESDIVCLINWFNQEYTWDKMFNINDVFDRINKGHILFILFHNKTAIGYVFFKRLNNKDCFGYNLYVTKKVDRPKWLPMCFYNNVSLIMLNYYDTINVEIEDWNTVVFNIVENTGYKIL